jgi:cephalosporin-C deacetylase-like acetyl esterase
VTALAVEVPAGCDISSSKTGRRNGWPYWGIAPKDIRDKVLVVSEYFDAAHFAERVKVKSIVAVGLIDMTCPPTAVLSAYNVIKGPKEIIYMPQGTHKDNHQEYPPAYKRFISEILGK